MRQNELSNESLDSAIDSIVAYIDEAQQRNYERWPILGEYVWPNYNWQGNTYNGEVAFFKNWFFNRLSWMDDNFPGTVLYPEAELSGTYPELEITLTDDYFSRSILKKKYFTLNTVPPGLVIDTVIFYSASQATIVLSGNLNEPAAVSVTMEAKILNSFDDLTSSSLSISVGQTLINEPEIVLFASQNKLQIACSQPELLGDKMEIFNLSGQRIKISKIEKVQLNRIGIDIIPGIYICRFQFDGNMYTQRVVYVK